MEIPRFEHGLVALTNGLVLAVGGHGTSDPRTVSSAEIYDPGADRWALTGGLLVARNEAERPRLLPNGLVLLAGGHDHAQCCDALTHSELFDPAARAWRRTGSLAHRRGEQEMILLRSGEMLAVGGFDWGTETAPAMAEIYNPASETWREASAFPDPGLQNFGEALLDGRALIQGNSDHRAVYLYTPDPGRFTATGRLGVPRVRPTLTLLRDGRVLAAGGRVNDIPSATAEIFDPRSETWTVARPMAVGRVRHTATMLRDGRVLVAGGNGASGPLSTAEIFDPMNGAWTTVPAMREARASHAAALLVDGRVIATGGETGAEARQGVEVFDPAGCQMP